MRIVEILDVSCFQRTPYNIIPLRIQKIDLNLTRNLLVTDFPTFSISSHVFFKSNMKIFDFWLS